MVGSDGIKALLRENRRVLYFLLRFVGAFGVLSISYALWLDRFGDNPDPFSWLVGKHLNLLFGGRLELTPIPYHAAIDVSYEHSSAVSLFEGCNGIAVMILFFAFVFAFKGRWVNLLWFVPAGFVVIHLFNLARLALLINLAHDSSPLFHFMHKYLFSLIIYAVVFGLWVIWVKWARGSVSGEQEYKDKHVSETK